MKPADILKLLLVAAMTASLSSCVTQRTVTRGGRTVESGYVIKKPFETPTANMN